jgi:hypothetical protein
MSQFITTSTAASLRKEDLHASLSDPSWTRWRWAAQIAEGFRGLRAAFA